MIVSAFGLARGGPDWHWLAIRSIMDGDTTRAH
jgi:hypothetical protein